MVCLKQSNRIRVWPSDRCLSSFAGSVCVHVRASRAFHFIFRHAATALLLSDRAFLPVWFDSFLFFYFKLEPAPKHKIKWGFLLAALWHCTVSTLFHFTGAMFFVSFFYEMWARAELRAGGLVMHYWAAVMQRELGSSDVWLRWVRVVEILTDFSISTDLNCEFVLLKILLTLFQKMKYAVLVTGWQAAHGV